LKLIVSDGCCSSNQIHVIREGIVDAK
jgi:hypothetical protein